PGLTSRNRGIVRHPPASRSKPRVPRAASTALRACSQAVLVASGGVVDLRRRLRPVLGALDPPGHQPRAGRVRALPDPLAQPVDPAPLHPRRTPRLVRPRWPDGRGTAPAVPRVLLSL